MAGLSIREQAFADLVLTGMAQNLAYVQAGYKATGAAIDAGASRLIRRPTVAAYIKAERKALSEAGRWEKWQLLDFYQQVLETPVGDLDEKSPLVQEVTQDEVGEATVRTKVKMVGKMEASQALARMMGWNAPEKVQHGIDDDLAEIIRLTRSQPA